MKRVVLLNALAVSFFVSYCQPDSLNKYAYLVYCRDSSNRIHFSAGFFIKVQKDIFFITANHITAETTCRDLVIVLNKKVNTVYEFGVSNIPKQALKTQFGEKDILIYKIPDKLPIRINSLEKFIPNYKKINHSKIRNVVYYGFPKVKNEPYFDFKTSFPSLVLSQDSIIGHYDYIRFNSSLNKSDSFNYVTSPINNSYSGEGDSGAPVFFKINNKYYFGGMCTAGVGTLRVAYILRPEIILQELKKKKN